jgi:hypothetical protein
MRYTHLLYSVLRVIKEYSYNNVVLSLGGRGFDSNDVTHFFHSPDSSSRIMDLRPKHPGPASPSVECTV